MQSRSTETQLPGSREQGCRESQRQISGTGGRTDWGNRVPRLHCHRAGLSKKAFLFVRNSGATPGGARAAGRRGSRFSSAREIRSIPGAGRPEQKSLLGRFAEHTKSVIDLS